MSALHRLVAAVRGALDLVELYGDDPLLDADMRREYQLDPWDAHDLPIWYWRRLIHGLSAQSLSVMTRVAARRPDRTAQPGTVSQVKPAPTSAEEARARFSQFRGFRG